jgi:hypothetical protein
MVKICAILAAGCDRETAAGVAECTIVDIARAIANLASFAIKVRHAEATAEIRHMQNILNATKDGKYWRASVWWLERRSPERFARRPPGAITSRQLEQAVTVWNDAMQQNFDSPADQQRLTACIDDITASLELILDAQGSASLLKRHIAQLRHDHPAPSDAESHLEAKSVAIDKRQPEPAIDAAQP